MLSKNNARLMNRKGQPQKQRFGLRKLSIGVASVLLGLTFLGASSASANEKVNAGQVTQEQIAAVQDVEITSPDLARQFNDNGVSNTAAAAATVSRENASAVVDNAASTAQTPVASAEPVIPGSTSFAISEEGSNDSSSTQPAPEIPAGSDSAGDVVQPDVNPVITNLQKPVTAPSMGKAELSIIVSPSDITQPAQQTQQQLPQTGNQQNKGVITGMMLVLTTLLLQVITFGLVNGKKKKVK